MEWNVAEKTIAEDLRKLYRAFTNLMTLGAQEAIAFPIISPSVN